MAKLRKVMDSTETFVGGHQIVHARTYKRQIPEWVLSDRKIREVVLRAFPNMVTSPRQRESALRWVSVIHLYYRMGYTRSQIAEEIGSTSLKVHNMIRAISRVSKGLRANGTGKITGKRGARNDIVLHNR